MDYLDLCRRKAEEERAEQEAARLKTEAETVRYATIAEADQIENEVSKLQRLRRQALQKINTLRR